MRIEVGHSFGADAQYYSTTRLYACFWSQLFITNSIPNQQYFLSLNYQYISTTTTEIVRPLFS